MALKVFTWFKFICETQQDHIYQQVVKTTTKETTSNNNKKTNNKPTVLNLIPA